MLKEYLRSIFGIASHSSWKAANGIAGAALAGFAMIWPGVVPFVPATRFWAQPTNWFFSFIMYAVIAWIVLLVFQLIFLAPYQLLKRERLNRANAERKTAIEVSHNRQIIEHDAKLASKLRRILPEPRMQKLTSNLLNEHAYRDTENRTLGDAITFLDSAEAHFLIENLQKGVKEFADAGADLLRFMGLKFFVYPSEQREPPLRFAMQPNWNLDREGDGSDEQIRKYDTLTDELTANVN